MTNEKNIENQPINIESVDFHIARSRKVSSKPPRGVKKNDYFGEREEEAIRKYLSPEITDIEKSRLYIRIIEPALIKLAQGALTLPQGQAVKYISKKELFEETLATLKEVLIKYDPESYRDENGKLPRAYSFFNTCASNFLKGYKRLQDKANKIDSLNSNPIEKFTGLNSALIDLSLERRNDQVSLFLSGEEEGEREKNQTAGVDFYLLKANLDTVIQKIEELLILLTDPNQKKSEKKKKCKQLLNQPSLNANEIKICRHLVYMLKKWHELDFTTKREFKEQLVLRSGESPQTAARTIKKLQQFILDSLSEHKNND